MLALVKKGDDFGELAKKYSADPGSKDSGGEYDDVKGTFVPEFEKAAFALETGKYTTTPVKSSFGYHIIKALEDTKPARVQTLDEVEDAIKEELETSAKDTAANDWFQQLLASYECQDRLRAGLRPAAEGRHVGHAAGGHVGAERHRRDRHGRDRHRGDRRHVGRDGGHGVQRRQRVDRGHVGEDGRPPSDDATSTG